jgi:hypothetical protein
MISVIVRILSVSFALSVFGAAGVKGCAEHSSHADEGSGTSATSSRRLLRKGIADVGFGKSGEDESFISSGIRWKSMNDFAKGNGRCKTRKATAREWKENMEMVEDFKKQMEKDHGRNRQLQTTPTTIRVNWVVVSDSAGVGDLTQQVIDSQMAVLNSSYNSTFRFNLTSLQRVQNSTLFNCAYGATNPLTGVYRVGGKAMLNLFSCNTGGGLGWANYPWSGAGGIRDAVIFSYKTVPGGAENRYNLGYVSIRRFFSDATSHGHYLISCLLHRTDSGS